MPVKETSKVLKSILSDITNTQRIIDKSQKLKKSLDGANFKNGRDTKKLFDETRDIIDELANEVLEISTTFHEFYDTEFKQAESDKNLKEDNTSGNDVICCESSVTNGSVNISSNVKKNTEKSQDIAVVKNVNDNKEKGDNRETRGMLNTNINKGIKTLTTLKSVLADDSTILEPEVENRNTSEESDKVKEEKAWIRCVDISKLIDPKTTTNSNTSVIVLSDSDSNSSPLRIPSGITLTRLLKQGARQSPRTPTPKKRSPTKGVLKTPTSETPQSGRKKSVTFRDPETSDIDDMVGASGSAVSRRTRLPPRKTRPIEIHDVSSLSEDSSDSSFGEEIAQSSKRQVTTKRKKGRKLSSPEIVKPTQKLDSKFSQKCFIRLARVHPATLKRNYEKLLLKNEVKRLTNIHSLKRTRKNRRDSSSSDSSSASDREPKRARKGKKTSNAPETAVETIETSSSSDNEVHSTQNIDVSKDDTNATKNVDDVSHAGVQDVQGDASEDVLENLLETLGHDTQDVNSSDASSSNLEADAKSKKLASKDKESDVSGNKEDESASNMEISNDKSTSRKEENSDSSEKSGSKIDNEKTDDTSNNDKAKWRKDKLLTASLSSSSDSEDNGKNSKKSKDKHLKKKDKELKDKNSSDSDTDEEISKSKENEKSNDQEKDKHKDEENKETNKEKTDDDGNKETNLKDKDENSENGETEDKTTKKSRGNEENEDNSGVNDDESKTGDKDKDDGSRDSSADESSNKSKENKNTKDKTKENNKENKDDDEDKLGDKDTDDNSTDSSSDEINDKKKGDKARKKSDKKKGNEKKCSSSSDDGDPMDNTDKDGNSTDDSSEIKSKDKSKKKRNSKEKTKKSDTSSSDDEISTKKGNKKNKDGSTDSSSDSDVVTNKKKPISKKKKETAGSDSDENFAKFLEKSEKIQEKSDAEEVTPSKQSTKRLTKKRRRLMVNSDSDSNSSRNRKSDTSDSESSKSSSDSDSEKEKKVKQPTKKRRRIKKVKDSSDEDCEDKSTRKQIRKVLTRDSLSETTIAAEKEEAERKARILEKQKKYNQIFEPDSLEKSTVDKVVLDFEEEREILVVHKDITKHLKPHQAKGVQFMWDTCFESVKRARKHKGSGCILAHCMGLGKTLQVITLIHTLLSNREKTNIEKILVVCPLSTVLNWVAEFKKWLPEDEEVNVFDLVSFKQNVERLYQIKEWDRCGGVLVLGYDMFRNLTNSAGKRLSKKLREGFNKYLVDPGPDLVICDEGHLLKNEKTSLSIAMNKLKTLRRIVLTGTPLQNNLKEYWCMVQFVKPNLLGTYKEYLNRFVNPITNGQYTDSTQHDTQLMRKRSHVLHKLLDGVVQRRDYAVLAPFLPPKHEYVLFVTLTEKQIKIYDHYMKEKTRRSLENTTRASYLFVDFQELQRICTHPRVLLDKSIENKIAREKKELEEDESEGSLKDFIDDGTDKSDTSNSSSSSDSESGSNSNDSSKKEKAGKGKRRVTRSTAAVVISESEEEEEVNKEPDPLEWWREFVNDKDLDDIQISGKLTLLFEILRHCESIGDKVLVFSQSLYSLNVIEYFLNKIDEATQNSETNSFCGFSGSWSLGLDYFRLDGSSSCDNRAAWCKTFNKTDNVRARLFLISTRAGGLGINLVAANRVIIFDVSWNPSHDIQSIYRVYRFGQTKPCYVYRFVTLGTMEMKIYERQVIKQAISKRVIDEQQIDRHYNQNDIAELYKFEPKPEGERPTPLVPVDVLLGELLQQQDQKIYKYHEHQSLLENKEDEVLDEEERKAAWEEFENEKKARQYTGSINHIPVSSIVKALTSILTRESPALTPQMKQELIPSMLEELQKKMASGDNTLYNKVIQEIRLMQATAQQQRIEEYYKLQQQQQQNLLLQQYQQRMMVNPLATQIMNQWTQAYNNIAGAPNQTGMMPHGSRQQQNMLGMPVPQAIGPQPVRDQRTSSTDVIELND